MVVEVERVESVASLSLRLSLERRESPELANQSAMMKKEVAVDVAVAAVSPSLLKLCQYREHQSPCASLVARVALTM